MHARTLHRICALVAGIGLAVGSFALCAQENNQHGRKYKAPPPAANIEVTILKDFNGKPIQDAHVIFHPTEGDSDRGSLELKTNEDGKAVIDVIPIGDTVTLQVIANGYQTYGQSFTINKPEMTMEIRLKRPGAQYSIYNNKSGSGGNSGNGSGSSGSSGASSNAPPPPAQPK